MPSKYLYKYQIRTSPSGTILSESDYTFTNKRYCVSEMKKERAAQGQKHGRKLAAICRRVRYNDYDLSTNSSDAEVHWDPEESSDVFSSQSSRSSEPKAPNVVEKMDNGETGQDGQDIPKPGAKNYDLGLLPKPEPSNKAQTIDPN